MQGVGDGGIQFYVVVKFKLSKSYISFNSNLLVEYKYFHGWIKKETITYILYIQITIYAS